MIQNVQGSHAIKVAIWPTVNIVGACAYKNMLSELTRQLSSTYITDILQYLLLKYSDAWLRCQCEYIMVRRFHYVFFHVFEVSSCCTARCALVLLKILFAFTCNSMQQNCRVGVDMIVWTDIISDCGPMFHIRNLKMPANVWLVTSPYLIFCPFPFIWTSCQ